MYKYREGLERWLSWESDCLASLKTWIGVSERTEKAVWSACYLRTAKELGGPRWTLGLTGQSVNATCRIPGQERDLVQKTNKQARSTRGMIPESISGFHTHVCTMYHPWLHTQIAYTKKAARACHLDMAYNIGNKMQNFLTTVCWGQC